MYGVIFSTSSFIDETAWREGEGEGGREGGRDREREREREGGRGRGRGREGEREIERERERGNTAGIPLIRTPEMRTTMISSCPMYSQRF